jgi:hypothetical protein
LCPTWLKVIAVILAGAVERGCLAKRAVEHRSLALDEVLHRGEVGKRQHPILVDGSHRADLALQGLHGGISHAGEEQHRHDHRGPEAGLEGDAAQQAHRRRGAQLQGGIGVQAGVERLGGGDLFRRGLEPDAHVARTVG